GNRKQAKRACGGRLQGVVGRHVVEAQYSPCVARAQRLLGSPQYHLSGAATCGSRGPPLQFVPGDSEWSFLINPVPVWKGTGLYVKRDGLFRFVDGVLTKVGDGSLHDSLVFFRLTFLAIGLPESGQS